MRTTTKLGAILAACTFVVGCAADPSVKLIHSASDLKIKMDAHEVRVIHALSADHFAKGHIPGAENVDYEKMTPQMLPADKNAPLVFYCAGPMCPVSKMAANKAAKWDYKNVWVYEGGMKDWQSSNMSVAKGGP